jgi:hypothetical protein
MPARIDISIRPTASLTPSELDEIWVVTDGYVDTTRSIYETKLKALPEIGLWRTRDGTLVGLVSLDVYRTRFDGRESIIFFTSSVATALVLRHVQLQALRVAAALLPRLLATP